MRVKTKITKDKQKSLAIGPTLKDCLDIIAKNEGKTLLDMTNFIINEYCREYIKSRCKLSIHEFVNANKVRF